MREKVFLRDWYYNAGIIGFLKIICDGDFDKKGNLGDKLLIGEDYIEFDLDVLDDFENKLNKQFFLNYFDLNQYRYYIDKSFKDTQNKKNFSIQTILKGMDKYPFVGLHNDLGFKLETYDDFLDYKEKINQYTKEQIYDKIKTTSFITNFVKQNTNGIISFPSLTKYLENARTCSFELKQDSDRPCMSCQTRKGKFEFSNAISNIIGFNPDNLNISWGFSNTKTQICSICSLIYLSASVSLVFHKKLQDKKYIYYFYFIDHNRNIKKLIDSYISFKEQLDQIKNKEIYPVMIKEAVKFAKKEQTTQLLNNISFVEIKENGLNGQTTKGYNVYSFSLDKKLAEFLNDNINKLPKGYYTVKKDYIDIEYEILRETVERRIYYNDIDRYIRMYFLSKNKNSNFKFMSNINMIINYILKYIAYTYKPQGGIEVDLERISRKGFVNGKELGNKLVGGGRKNQINGLVYQFLNDLRIADRDRFLDKYMRSAVSSQLNVSFGLDEMNSKEAFLHFGYSFVQGLLSTLDNYKNNQGGQNE